MYTVRIQISDTPKSSSTLIWTYKLFGFQMFFYRFSHVTIIISGMVLDFEPLQKLAKNWIPVSSTYLNGKVSGT